MHAQLRNNDQILHGDQTRCEEIFLQRRPQMLTHDLFAVDNLLDLTTMYYTVECTGIQRSHGSMSQTLVSPSCEYE